MWVSEILNQNNTMFVCLSPCIHFYNTNTIQKNFVIHNKCTVVEVCNFWHSNSWHFKQEFCVQFVCLQSCMSVCVCSHIGFSTPT